MAHGRYRLSAKTVERVKEPGVLLDGGGLRLRVAVTGEGSERHVTRRWLLRVMVGGVSKELGLGSYPEVGLETAREKAEEAAKALKNGTPTAVVSGTVGHGRRPTFAQVFEQFFKVKEPTLSNPKHVAQWRNTLETYVFPKLGSRPIADIRPAEVIEVLMPIWNTKAETAHRVLRRMRSVFEWGILHEQRERADPTIGIAKKLGTKHRRIEHLRAMPFAEVPAFVARLKAMGPTPARLAMRFATLTAARSGEVRGARLAEIVNGDWVVPAERMKGRKAHTVPLSRQAKSVLEEARKLPRTERSGDLIFPSPQGGAALSDMALTKLLRDLELGDVATAHGFRSAFKDWAASNGVADQVSEAALAHADKDRVRAAYLRSTFIDERRELMQKWGDFVDGGRKGVRPRPGVRRAGALAAR